MISRRCRDTERWQEEEQELFSEEAAKFAKVGLQRHGMWVTVLASAVFRGFRHATMGVSGLYSCFRADCFSDFFTGGIASYGRSSSPIR